MAIDAMQDIVEDAIDDMIGMSKWKFRSFPEHGYRCHARRRGKHVSNRTKLRKI